MSTENDAIEGDESGRIGGPVNRRTFVARIWESRICGDCRSRTLDVV